MAHLIIGRKVHYSLSQMVEILEREKTTEKRKTKYVRKAEQEKMGNDREYRTVKQRKGGRQKERHRVRYRNKERQRQRDRVRKRKGKKGRGLGAENGSRKKEYGIGN